MPPVLIACPETNDLVPTGAHVNALKDLERLPDGNLLIACPDCGRDHEWTAEDAVVAAG